MRSASLTVAIVALAADAALAQRALPPGPVVLLRHSITLVPPPARFRRAAHPVAATSPKHRPSHLAGPAAIQTEALCWPSTASMLSIPAKTGLASPSSIFPSSARLSFRVVQ